MQKASKENMRMMNLITELPTWKGCLEGCGVLEGFAGLKYKQPT